MFRTFQNLFCNTSGPTPDSFWKGNVGSRFYRVGTRYAATAWVRCRTVSGGREGFFQSPCRALRHGRSARRTSAGASSGCRA